MDAPYLHENFPFYLNEKIMRDYDIELFTVAIVFMSVVAGFDAACRCH